MKRQFSITAFVCLKTKSAERKIAYMEYIFQIFGYGELNGKEKSTVINFWHRCISVIIQHDKRGMRAKCTDGKCEPKLQVCLAATLSVF